MNFIQTVSIWDILDILIVAYLIYRIITVVRKTSSASVIKGIILLLAVMWLSSLLNLNVINYLLGQTMKLGVLVLIVLFQPELRRFLEQMGSSNFRMVFARKVKIGYMEACISNTVAACMEMSRKRMGALIVFEREIALVDHIKTGTKLDAILTAELLKSIFFPKAPLHDGAVIVRDGRISAAACMLPMSSNINISRDLGMRHRSGIGMSEVSDAVVVIVSEETGSISVAIDGMLKRHLAHETFEKLLRNELLAEESRPDTRTKLRNRFKVKK
ncbi:diadenylate cyclase CdaA [Sporobacter termitidis]|uniref:diadenylate cyclase CdaA n=1 Tax=Sporobacter termitidis TaxID=44749 RepID=UPI001FA8E108|nr:diadenylate cyclase CdaA [Sporobacter termitidis]